MILPKDWRKAASEAWKDEAENAGAFADESPKSNFMNGFEQGANEYANAVEAMLNHRIERVETLANMFSQNVNTSAVYQELKTLLSELSNLTPPK